MPSQSELKKEDSKMIKIIKIIIQKLSPPKKEVQKLKVISFEQLQKINYSHLNAIHLLRLKYYYNNGQYN